MTETGVSVAEPERVDLTSGKNLELPSTIDTVEMGLDGTQAEHCHLFQLLNNLPHLNRLNLGWKFGNADREILAFPKLLRCLELAIVHWPACIPLLEADNGLKLLNAVLAKDSDVALDGGSSFWSSFRRLRKLRWLHLTRCPTSVLATLPDLNFQFEPL
jgi:hypothetical protein